MYNPGSNNLYFCSYITLHSSIALIFSICSLFYFILSTVLTQIIARKQVVMQSPLQRHDIRAIFSTLRVGRSYRAPLMKKSDWNEESGRQYSSLAPRSQALPPSAHYVRQGAGRPSTGSTGATVSIFLGRDSEAGELRAELGSHSLIVQ